MILIFKFIVHLGHFLCLLFLFHLLLLLLLKLIINIEIEFRIIFGQGLSTRIGFHQIGVIFIVVEFVLIFKVINSFFETYNIKYIF